MKRAFVEINDMNNSTPNKVMLIETTANRRIQFIDATTKLSPHNLIDKPVELREDENIIAKHVTHLQDQNERKVDRELDYTTCNFVKRPGNVYHLYEKPLGQRYFSMLSPTEWGISSPIQIYKGSYRLEYDHSWTPLSQTNIKDIEYNFIRHLCTNKNSEINFPDAMDIDFKMPSIFP